MAKQRFMSRHINEIAGTFVLLILAIVIVGTVMIGWAQEWFSPAMTLSVELPQEGSFGLRPGAEAQILGAVAGSVDKIVVDEDGTMRCQVSIRKDFTRFVCEDSKALIRKRFGVAGDAFLEISKGSGPALPQTGASIPSLPYEELPGMVDSLLDEIRREVVPALRQMKDAAEEYAQLARELRAPEGNLQQLLRHLDGIAKDIDQGQGSAGRLLTDPTFAKQAEEVLTKASASMSELHGVLEDIRSSTEKLPAMTRTIGEETEHLPGLVLKTQAFWNQLAQILSEVQETTSQLPGIVRKISEEVDTLPGLLIQTQETLREIEILVEGMQKHSMVREHVDQSGLDTRIAPTAIGSEWGKP